MTDLSGFLVQQLIEPVDGLLVDHRERAGAESQRDCCCFNVGSRHTIAEQRHALVGVGLKGPAGQEIEGSHGASSGKRVLVVFRPPV